MAIKNIIAKGIGFSPATLKWIPTHGFGIGSAATIPPVTATIISRDATNKVISRGKQPTIVSRDVTRKIK